jgi:DNA-binding NtrC family response regulator
MLEVENGGFRKDLYYRLNVVEILIPPLRERKEDMEILIDHIMKRLGREMGIPKPRISAEALEILKRYHWPGNVRELENCLERALLLAQGPTIQKVHIPERTFKKCAYPSDGLASLHHTFRRVIESTLDECGGNISVAARRLRIARSTLYRKMKEFGLSCR